MILLPSAVGAVQSCKSKKHMTININYTLTERTELDKDYRHLDANKNSVIQNINMYWFSYSIYHERNNTYTTS